MLFQGFVGNEISHHRIFSTIFFPDLTSCIMYQHHVVGVYSFSLSSTYPYRVINNISPIKKKIQISNGVNVTVNVWLGFLGRRLDCLQKRLVCHGAANKN